MSLLGKVGEMFGLGGNQSEGGDASADAMRAEEARKERLRRKVDIMFGIAPRKAVGSVRPYAGAPALDMDGALDIGGMAKAVAGWNTSEKQRLKNLLALDVAKAGAARNRMSLERDRITEALRGYHTDQLGRRFTDSSRELKFNLARRGLYGGSVDVDQNARLREDRDMGGTRIDEAVRRAATNLEGERENQRLSAHQLINSGAGSSAVTAAQRGMQGALANAANAQKEQLFNDLFTGTVDTFAGANEAERRRSIGARYGTSLRSFFPTASSGRITADE